MQNISVSSQLTAPPKASQSANASAAASTSATGSASDENTPESSADVFGRILAQQMTAAKPGKAETIIAELKGRSKDGDKPTQDDAATGAIVPVLIIDPNALPIQKFQAANASDRGASETALTRGVPSAMSAISGKDLPVQGGKPADVAVAVQPPVAQDMVAQADVDTLAHSFESILADKRAGMSSDAPTQVQNNVVPAMQAPVVAQQAATDVPQQKALTVPQQVGAADWGSGLGDKVVWMVGNQTRGAEIHLNPPALGPLEVRVSISDGQANLSFMTHHAAVREAIEAATPRLREMLGDNGIGMGSVSVDVGSFAQQQPQQQQADGANKPVDPNAWFSLNGEGDPSAKAFTTFVQPARGRGAVDYFA